MDPELQLARFVHGTSFESLPEEALAVVQRMVLTTLGTAVAGAGEEGCPEIHDFVLEQQGPPQATVLVHGDRVPAAGAALINGAMCRALDFCDAMAPGLHIGSSLIPAGLAAAELRGGCSGREFLAALTVGAEVASRLNLTEQAYDGADPTGVAAVFGATAAAARLLGLDRQQTLHALALAFNRAGGSLQCNVDGSLAVRLIQGWVAESGVICAQLAGKGITGPENFLKGVYGYAHLFAKDLCTPDSFVDGLGADYRVLSTMFKKFPSCGLSQGATELALQARKALSLTPAAVQSISVRLPPYAYKLVGHPFDIGTNPRVNAQFSVQYCIANAIVRGHAQLEHFTEASIRDPEVTALANRVEVKSEEALNARGHTAVDLATVTTDAERHEGGLDIAPGFPGNGLSDAEHMARFRDCMAYAKWPLPPQQATELPEAVATLPACEDVCSLLALTLKPRETAV